MAIILYLQKQVNVSNLYEMIRPLCSVSLRSSQQSVKAAKACSSCHTGCWYVRSTFCVCTSTYIYILRALLNCIRLSQKKGNLYMHLPNVLIHKNKRGYIQYCHLSFSKLIALENWKHNLARVPSDSKTKGNSFSFVRFDAVSTTLDIEMIFMCDINNTYAFIPYI